MTKIMIRVIVIALILMLFGFNGAASTLLGGMLSVVKWIFIIGGVILVGFIIFGKKNN